MPKRPAEKADTLPLSKNAGLWSTLFRLNRLCLDAERFCKDSTAHKSCNALRCRNGLPPRHRMSEKAASQAKILPEEAIRHSASCCRHHSSFAMQTLLSANLQLVCKFDYSKLRLACQAGIFSTVHCGHYSIILSLLTLVNRAGTVQPSIFLLKFPLIFLASCRKRRVFKSSRLRSANLGVLLRTCVRGSRPLSVRTYAAIDRKRTL